MTLGMLLEAAGSLASTSKPKSRSSGICKALSVPKGLIFLYIYYFRGKERTHI